MDNIQICLASHKFNNIIIIQLLTGSCPLLWNSSVLSIIQYNLDVSGALSALIRCTIQDNNEIYVIECGVNGQWSTDIDLCTSINLINSPKGKGYFLTGVRRSIYMYIYIYILSLTETASTEKIIVSA